MATAGAKTEGKSVFYVYGGLGEREKKKKDLNYQEGDAEGKKNHGRVKHWMKFLGMPRSGRGTSSPWQELGWGSPSTSPGVSAARFSCEPRRSSLYWRAVECLAN